MAGGVSSVLRSVQYDRQKQELIVTFKNGSIYVYSAVPPAQFQALLTAPSQGSYFSRHIRNQKSYRKVSGTDAQRFTAAGVELE